MNPKVATKRSGFGANRELDSVRALFILHTYIMHISSSDLASLYPEHFYGSRDFRIGGRLLCPLTHTGQLLLRAELGIYRVY